MADEIVKYYGAKTFFNDDVTFYKDVNIQGNLNYDSLTVKNLTVTEQSRLGITTTTNLFANQLSVSGVSTLGILTTSNATITTATITTAAITTANVSYLTGVGAGTSVQVSSGSKLVGLSTGSVIYPGAVLQVVQTVKKDNWTSSSDGTSFYDVTGLNATITPTSISSKILVEVVCQCSCAYWEIQGRLTRNASVLTGALGDQRGSRTRCTFSVNEYAGSAVGYGMYTATIKYLDSPASTSAQTYQVQLNGYSTYGLAVNANAYSDLDSADYYGTPISTITLTEISG